MPLISTNDPALHQKLKIFVARNPNLTIGKAVEKFTRFALDTGIGELSDADLEEIKELIKQYQRN